MSAAEAVWRLNGKGNAHKKESAFLTRGLISTMLISTLLLTLVVDSATSPAIRVCGIDASASVRSVEKLQQHCAQVVRRARPGDVVIVRWITDSSFRSSDEILAVRLPKSTASCNNPYDARCRREAQRGARRLAEVRDSAARVVSAAVARTARRTDIVGFFAAAAAKLAELSEIRSRFVYVTGDLQDTAGQRSNVDLGGAQVVFVGLESNGDINASVSNRKSWVSRLRGWKAGVVRTCVLVDEEC